MSLLFKLLPSDFKSFYSKEGLRIFIGGMSGSGKSYLAKTFVEELMKYFKIIVIDPEGEWKALKAIAETIVVGSSDDVPLEPKLFKKYISTGTHVVFNLREVLQSEQAELMTEIMKTVFEVSKPCIVVIEEAQLAAPQRLDKIMERKSLDQVVQIAKRGRKRGIGLVTCTQRPADINKSVISQSNIRFFGKVIDKADLDALRPYLQTASISYKEMSRLSNGLFFFYDGLKAQKIRSPGIQMPDLGSATGVEFDFEALETDKLDGLIDDIRKWYENPDELDELDETNRIKYELEQTKKGFNEIKKELEAYKGGDSTISDLLTENKRLKTKFKELVLRFKETQEVIRKQKLVIDRVKSMMRTAS